jgi:hypothetical protein
MPRKMRPQRCKRIEIVVRGRIDSVLRILSNFQKDFPDSQISLHYETVRIALAGRQTNWVAIAPSIKFLEALVKREQILNMAWAKCIRSREKWLDEDLTHVKQIVIAISARHSIIPELLERAKQRKQIDLN